MCSQTVLIISVLLFLDFGKESLEESICCVIGWRVCVSTQIKSINGKDFSSVNCVLAFSVYNNETYSGHSVGNIILVFSF